MKLLQTWSTVKEIDQDITKVEEENNLQLNDSLDNSSLENSPEAIIEENKIESEEQADKKE